MLDPCGVEDPLHRGDVLVALPHVVVADHVEPVLGAARGHVDDVQAHELNRPRRIFVTAQHEDDLVGLLALEGMDGADVVRTERFPRVVADARRLMGAKLSLDARHHRRERRDDKEARAVRLLCKRMRHNLGDALALRLDVVIPPASLATGRVEPL